jgi:hypothetical protein
MKAKNKSNYLKERGITLIALVITIVVLLILAGVSLNAIFSENGIIKRAKDAQNKMDQATQNDLDAINGLNEWINKNINGTNGGEDIEKGDFSATVVLNPAENEAQPTFEQKKEIAAILCNFSSYEELTKEYGDKISQLNITEEQFVNKIIEEGRMFISYNNAEEVAKLKNLGVKIITVETPYGSTLYTSNLGEPVKCSFNKNGSYDFIIKSDGEEKKETIKVDSIRTSAQTSPYKVKLEKFLLTKGCGILYSTDETNIWKELNEENVVECNKSISIKFSGSKPEGTIGYGLHYVEKNDEYYKYFNDQNPMEWGLIRSHYFITYGLKINPPIRRKIIETKLLGTDATKVMLSNLNTSRNIDFLNEFSSWQHGNSLTKEMLQKYPELALGHDRVITWTESGGEESPIYKLEVDHDMSVILHAEIWD